MSSFQAGSPHPSRLPGIHIALLDTAIPSRPALEDYVKQAELLAIDHNVSIEVVSIKNVPLVGDATFSEATILSTEEETKEPFPSDVPSTDV